MKYPFDCISDFIFVNDDDIEPSDIILIPGGSHLQLMEKAAELYIKGLAPLILASGNFNPKIPEYPSEWEYLKSIGLNLGIPEEAILKEDRALNTFENAQFLLKVIQEYGLNIKKAILVCKSFHSRRALLTYQTVFPKEISFFVASVIDKSGIHKQNWYQDEESIHIVMNEVARIGQYFEKHIINWYKQYRDL